MLLLFLISILYVILIHNVILILIDNVNELLFILNVIQYSNVILTLLILFFVVLYSQTQVLNLFSFLIFSICLVCESDQDTSHVIASHPHCLLPNPFDDFSIPLFFVCFYLSCLLRVKSPEES